MRWFTAPFTYHLDVPAQMRLCFKLCRPGRADAHTHTHSDPLGARCSAAGTAAFHLRNRLERRPAAGGHLPPLPPHQRRPRGQGRAGEAASAPVRPGGRPGPAPPSMPRARPAGRAGARSEAVRSGVPAAAPLLKAKAGARRRGDLLPGVAVPEGLPSDLGRGTRRAKGALWKSRHCSRCAVSSPLMTGASCSHASKRRGGFQKVAVSWADWTMSLYLLSKM